MAPIPDKPGDMPDLNTTLQSLVTFALWGLTIALIVYAVYLSRRDRSPIALYLVLAVAVGSLIEPLYDISYHLFWHAFDETGANRQWTLFEAFHLPQPVWVMPAYVVVFAGPAIFMYKGLAKSTSTRHVFKLALITACTTAAFEILMINLELYSYWSPQTLRVLDYPIWIAFMEAAQITGFALLVALLSRKATNHWQLLTVFVLFPANFAYSTLGAGFPGIIAINSSESPSEVLMACAGLASIGLAMLELWWIGRLLVRDQEAHPDQEAWSADRAATAGPPAATPPVAPPPTPVGAPGD
ncbi:MAG: hypothetical protein M0P31_16565 [Solirubrobacteraceae bacterium]|nr:hypothetical protein [Solirubrobacteraceae bacterium]